MYLDRRIGTGVRIRGDGYNHIDMPTLSTARRQHVCAIALDVGVAVINHAVTVYINRSRCDYARSGDGDAGPAGEKTHLVGEVSAVRHAEGEIDAGLSGHDIGPCSGIRSDGQPCD